MQRFLNVENAWDREVSCSEVMWSNCLITEEEIVAAISERNIGKAGFY